VASDLQVQPELEELVALFRNLRSLFLYIHDAIEQPTRAQYPWGC
jgi:hypothetical protein